MERGKTREGEEREREEGERKEERGGERERRGGERRGGRKEGERRERRAPPKRRVMAHFRGLWVVVIAKERSYLPKTNRGARFWEWWGGGGCQGEVIPPQKQVQWLVFHVFHVLEAGEWARDGESGYIFISRIKKIQKTGVPCMSRCCSFWVLLALLWPSFVVPSCLPSFRPVVVVFFTSSCWVFGS